MRDMSRKDSEAVQKYEALSNEVCICFYSYLFAFTGNVFVLLTHLPSVAVMKVRGVSPAYQLMITICISTGEKTVWKRFCGKSRSNTDTLMLF